MGEEEMGEEIGGVGEEMGEEMREMGGKETFVLDFFFL